MDNPLLIKRKFLNERMGKIGVKIIGERGTGKTTEITKEAYNNLGILVVPNRAYTENIILPELGVNKNDITILSFDEFENGATIGLEQPLYVDEIGLLYRRYDKLDSGEMSKICGFTETICDYDFLWRNR